MRSQEAKVGGTYGALVRLIVTENGIPYQARALWGRSHRSSRRSHDLPGGLGKPVVGPRVTGEPLEPDAATRNAERPKGEKRELASRLTGNSYSRFARCADGKGLRERYLASRLSYLGYPLEKCATEDAITSFFALVIRQAENDPVAHCAVSALFWNGYPHEMRNEVIGSSERDQRCASLRRKKTKIPVRRTYEQYRLCCRDYPDFSASAAFDSALVRGGCYHSALPDSAGNAFRHRATGPFCPTSFLPL